MSDVFPRLKVLRDVQTLVDSELHDCLSSTGIVGCQHILSTTGSLIDALCKSGVRASNVFLLGKIYSSNLEVATKLSAFGCEIFEGSSARVPGSHAITIREDSRRLWAVAIEKLRDNGVKQIVVLDDGGSVHLEMPDTVKEEFKVAGVEQTTYGIAHHAAISTRGIPIVNVATSAVKRFFETPLVIEATIDRVSKQLQSHGTVGVLGLGKIGIELATALRKSGKKVIGFDTNGERMELFERHSGDSKIQRVFSECSIVFGCTGRDSVPADILLGREVSVGTLASCSSGDIEFRGVLQGNVVWKRLSSKGVTRCPTLQTTIADNHVLQVLRSGYPVNFDNSSESVPPDQIQLTRGLLMCAVLQACKLFIDGKPLRFASSIMLSPRYQQFVLSSWCRNTGHETRGHNDLSWIERESQGMRYGP